MALVERCRLGLKPALAYTLQEMVGEARLVVRSRRLNAPRDGKLCPGADRKVQLPAVKAAALASIPLDDVIGRDDVDAIAECGTPSASSHFLQGTTATRVCLPRERPRARGAIDKGERRVDAESRQSLTEAAQAPVLRRRWEQASHNGDLAHAVKDRRIDRDDVTQLGDVLAGTAEGRRAPTRSPSSTRPASRFRTWRSRSLRSKPLRSWISRRSSSRLLDSDRDVTTL